MIGNLLASAFVAQAISIKPSKQTVPKTPEPPVIQELEREIAPVVDGDQPSTVHEKEALVVSRFVNCHGPGSPPKSVKK